MQLFQFGKDLDVMSECGGRTGNEIVVLEGSGCKVAVVGGPGTKLYFVKDLEENLLRDGGRIRKELLFHEGSRCKTS
jgi:hypothetical protein